MLRVLVIDDEPGIRSLCRAVLEGEGCAVVEAADLAAAGRALDVAQFDLALLDVRLPDGSGLDFFRTLRETHADLPVAIITGHASVEDAVDAVKAGALDYVPKPFDVSRLQEIVAAASTRQPAHAARAGATVEFHGIVAASREMRSIIDLVRRAAQTPSTVLIQGESGTGKEMVAKAIHKAGPNAGQPFVPVDCSAIPGPLLESELFGHTRGSFTGAVSDSPGLFRAAARGTVFLDEIAELPHPLQAKLLRALQEREVRAIGATEPVAFHARVIVATNRDLQTAMADGEFRRDLFYRLHVIPIYLPPLRQRRDDVAPLALRFLDELNGAAGRRLRFTQAALDALRRHPWPGNVRELHNVVERAFALAPGDLIGEEHLPPPARPEPPRGGDRMDDYEKQAILTALQKSGGNRERAAKALGIGVATLFRRLKKYGIKDL